MTEQAIILRTIQTSSISVFRSLCLSCTFLIAGNELLLAQDLHAACGQGIYAFYNSNCGKAPAAATFAAVYMLILDWPHNTSISPIY